MSGCRGIRSSCEPVKSTTASRCELSGRMTASQARASGPSPSAVRSMSRQAMPARPPSSGWAYETSGVTQSMRSRSRNARKNGELSAAGWTAEPTSWRNPGSVSSAVRTPPPDRVGGFEDADGVAGTGEGDGGGEPVGPTADHGCAPGHVLILPPSAHARLHSAARRRGCPGGHQPRSIAFSGARIALSGSKISVDLLEAS